MQYTIDHEFELPNELWLRIFRCIPLHDALADSAINIFTPDSQAKLAEQYFVRRRDLHSIALTCRLFHRCVNQELWSAVSLHPDDLGTSAKKLDTTMRKDPDLARFVKRVDFSTNRITLGKKDAVTTMALVSKFTNLEILSINAWAATPQLLNLSNLRTIALHYAPLGSDALLVSANVPRGSTAEMADTHTHHNWDSTNSHAQNLNKIICLPSLRSFQLSWARSNFNRYSDSKFNRLEKYWARDTTALSLKVFTWIGIETRFQTVTPIISRLHRPERIVFVESSTKIKGAGNFATAVHQHSDSLREFIMQKRCTIRDRKLAISSFVGDERGLIDLHKFTSLKSLGVRLAAKSLGDLPIHTIIPPQLEVLQIGFEIPDDPTGKQLVSVGAMIKKHLDGLLDARSTNHPTLQKVVCWAHPVWQGKVLQWLQEQLPAYWTQFKAIGIELEWSLAISTEDTPLVCGYPRFSSVIEDMQSRIPLADGMDGNAFLGIRDLLLTTPKALRNLESGRGQY